MNAVNQTNPVLRGNYGPIDQEVVLTDLKVIGEMPKDLNGIYVRNGPNRHFAAPGALPLVRRRRHAARRRSSKTARSPTAIAGCATDSLREEEAAGRALWQGVMEPPRRDRPDMPLKDTSNTDVMFHAGALVAMWYLAGGLTRSIPPRSTTLGQRGFRRHAEAPRLGPRQGRRAHRRVHLLRLRQDGAVHELWRGRPRRRA